MDFKSTIIRFYRSYGAISRFEAVILFRHALLIAPNRKSNLKCEKGYESPTEHKKERMGPRVANRRLRNPINPMGQENRENCKH